MKYAMKLSMCKPHNCFMHMIDHDDEACKIGHEASKNLRIHRVKACNAGHLSNHIPPEQNGTEKQCVLLKDVHSSCNHALGNHHLQYCKSGM